MDTSQASTQHLSTDMARAWLVEQAKTDPSIRITDTGINLLDLPFEVLSIIFGMVIDEHAEGLQHLTINVARTRSKRFYGGKRFPEAFSKLRGLIRFDDRTKDLVAKLVGARFQFYNHISGIFDGLPDTFGRANCHCITWLELTMDENTRRAPDRIWPGIFNVLRKYLPLLAYFEISYRISTNDEDELPKELVAERMAPLIHFMSCLLPGHPSLRRAIVPARNGPSYEYDEYGWEEVDMVVIADKGFHNRPGDMTREWKTRSKWTEPNRTARIMEEVSKTHQGRYPSVLTCRQDQVLNTQATRLLTLSELKRTPISDLLIHPHTNQHKDEIWISELPGPNFSAIDDRAYLLSWQLRRKFGVGYRSHERLVKKCRRGPEL